jgi:hypothetical protein
VWEFDLESQSEFQLAFGLVSQLSLLALEMESKSESQLALVLVSQLETQLSLLALEMESQLESQIAFGMASQLGTQLALLLALQLDLMLVERWDCWSCKRTAYEVTKLLALPRGIRPTSLYTKHLQFFQTRLSLERNK